MLACRCACEFYFPGCSACTSSPTSGSVDGVFEMVGGVCNCPTPVGGTVTLHGPEGSYVIEVGRTGRFTVEVPTGTYNVTGRSPQLNGGGLCDGPAIHVGAGKVVPGGVYCQRR